jgi:hypothetical protein
VHAVPLDEPVAPPAVDVGDHAFRRVDLRRPRDRLRADGWLVELQSVLAGRHLRCLVAARHRLCELLDLAARRGLFELLVLDRFGRAALAGR